MAAMPAAPFVGARRVIMFLLEIASTAWSRTVCLAPFTAKIFPLFFTRGSVWKTTSRGTFEPCEALANKIPDATPRLAQCCARVLR